MSRWGSQGKRPSLAQKGETVLYPNLTHAQAHDRLVAEGVDLPHLALYKAMNAPGEDTKVTIHGKPDTAVWVTYRFDALPSRAHFVVFVCTTHADSSGPCNACGYPSES